VAAANPKIAATLLLTIEPIAQNHLGNQVVGRTSEAHAESEIDLPLLLLRDRVKSRHRTHRILVFQTSRDFRSEIVAEFEVWRKDIALLHALTMERAIEREIQSPIPAA